MKSSAIPLKLQEVVAAWDRGAADTAMVVEQAVQLLIESDSKAVVLPIAMLPPNPGRLDLTEVVDEVYRAAGDQSLFDARRTHALALAWLARRYIAGDVTADSFCDWAINEWADLDRPDYLVGFVLNEDYYSEGAITREEFVKRVDTGIRQLVARAEDL